MAETTLDYIDLSPVCLYLYAKYRMCICSILVTVFDLSWIEAESLNTTFCPFCLCVIVSLWRRHVYYSASTAHIRAFLFNIYKFWSWNFSLTQQYVCHDFIHPLKVRHEKSEKVSASEFLKPIYFRTNCIFFATKAQIS